MIIRKLLTLFIISAMGITPILSSLSVSSVYVSTYNIDVLEIPKSHVIEGVPYVSQEINLYCAFASFTMLLNYFEGINLTLTDVLFYSGVGYSLIYPGYNEERMPLDGVGSSQTTGFLTNLFGLTRKSWNPEMNSISEDERWQEYWDRVKENISNDVPVFTSVDPFKLSSFRRLVDLPDFLWDLMPPGGHAIVIVGYNDSNGTVCYNDPAAALSGHPEYGTYAWMNIKDFNEAVSTTIGANYIILTFKKAAEPLSKQEAFNRSHARNIERLKGNLSAYDEFYINLFQESEFGIYGLKLMQKHFDKGIQNRFKTINFYKLEGKLGILYRLSIILGPVVAKILNLPFDSAKNSKIDAFRAIGFEKSYTANFLNNNPELCDNNEYEAMLLDQEAKLWNDLSSCYTVFLKKGIFLSLPRAILLTTRMKNYIDQIIEIEEKIINFGVK